VAPVGSGDQQAGSDLLVAQAFGDQLRHLDLPLREWSERDVSSRPRLDLLGFAKREAHGLPPESGMRCLRRDAIS
jgi:hypothetical protein